MTRIKLREPRTPEQELAFYQERYPQGYDHTVWPDHVERLHASVEFLSPWIQGRRITTAADLSCGDGALIDLLPWPVEERTKGDLVAGPYLDVIGPLPDTLETLTGTTVDLYLCSETLEHVADPDALLYTISQYAEHLFVSTPVGEPQTSGNLEHYWSWNPGDVRDMLTASGWLPMAYQRFRPVYQAPGDPHPYTFQFWLAERSSL